MSRKEERRLYLEYKKAHPEEFPRKKPVRTLTPENAAWLEEEIPRYLQRQYDQYESAVKFYEDNGMLWKKPEEPCIRVTDMFLEFDQTGGKPGEWEYRSSKTKRGWIQGIADKLVRKGILDTSIGPSYQEGRSVKCYEMARG